MRRIQDPSTGEVGYLINGHKVFPTDSQTAEDLLDKLEESKADWYEHLADCAREGDADD